MKKCYTYKRVSTEAQVDGFSLEAQQERLIQYADYRELQIVGEYCDAGKSGHSIKGRPAFRQMMNDIIDQKDHISFVLVYKLSRFGRNAADVLKSMQTLTDYDVDLVCVEDAIDSSTQGGRLTMTILSAVAEIERENINAQFMAGKRQKALSGGWLGGSVPYGYRTVDRQLVVEADEAEIVKKIFELYLRDDMQATSVVRFLNDNGYERKRGDKASKFNRDFVVRILDNPIYGGKIVYGRRANDKQSDENQPDVLSVKGIHEPLVSESLWEEAHEKRKRLAVRPEKTDDPERVSLLAGLIKCPLCGVGMYSKKDKTANKNYGGYYDNFYSYACKNYRKSDGRSCTLSRTYSQKKVDAAVFEIFSNLTLLPEFRERIAENMGNQNSPESLEEDLRNLRKKLRKEERKKQKLTEEMDALDVLAADYDKQYGIIEQKLDEVYDSMDQCDAQIEAVAKKLSSLKSGKQIIEKTVEMLDNMTSLYEQMSCKEKREMYHLFIERIEVYPESADGRILKSITFKIPVFYQGETVREKKLPDEQFYFTLDCSRLEKTAAESKASYPQIKSYIYEKYGVKVATLYISQIKRKYGIEMRKCYNHAKSPDARTPPKCSRAKEEMIVDALKYYKMLDRNTELLGEEL